MPTVGWILEDAVDRFWEAQPVSFCTEAPPREFVCGRCGEILKSADDLRRHYSLTHPLELPELFVNGEPLLRESAIRSAFSTRDIELFRCTRCQVQIDGDAWCDLTPLQFKSQFSRAKTASWNIRLLHDREEDNSQAREAYHVRFRIPKAVELNAVDENFIETVARDELANSNLDQFQASLPQDVATREYGAALGDYALAILLKERRKPPHSQVTFEDFAFRMRAALEVLREFDRPVAIAVCSSIRFNFNDFSDYGIIAATEVDLGIRYFRGIVGGTGTKVATAETATVVNPKYHRPICPIDHISHRLISVCAALAASHPFSLTMFRSLRDLIEGAQPISEQDIAKIHVICADGLLRIGDESSARPHLLAIQFDPVFKDWAQIQLTSTSSYGL